MKLDKHLLITITIISIIIVWIIILLTHDWKYDELIKYSEGYQISSIQCTKSYSGDVFLEINYFSKAGIKHNVFMIVNADIIEKFVKKDTIPSDYKDKIIKAFNEAK